MNHLDIIHKLEENGFEAYIVGGAVRDMFSNTVPKDVDIATNASPEEVADVFAGEKVTMAGAFFRVVLVDGYEIASYREDEYFGFSDKNVKVIPAKTIEEDLSRRDFTINSMAYHIGEGRLVDPYNGMEDLVNRVIRFTLEARKRIKEDPCRIIRACRFLARREATFDNDTFDALRENSYLLKTYVSPERIRNEILLAMRYKYAGIFFAALQDIDGLKYIFPSLSDCVGLDGGPYHNEEVFTHSMCVGGRMSTACPYTRLAGFLHDVGKFQKAEVNEAGEIIFRGHEEAGYELVKEDLKRLKFSKVEIKHVTNLIKYHMRSVFIGSSGKAVRKLLRAFKEDGVYYMDWIRLRVADRGGNKAKSPYSIQKVRDLINTLEREMCSVDNNNAFSIKDLVIGGDDVMRILDITQGKKVGEVLKFCLDRVIDFPELNNVENLEDQVRLFKIKK